MDSIVRTLVLTTANTEYSITLGAGLSQVTMQCRTAFAVRFATTSGKVAGSTEPYGTLKSGQALTLSDANPNATGQETWYFASAEAGVVMEFVETFNG